MIVDIDSGVDLEFKPVRAFFRREKERESQRLRP
jgi:hypothetical protein